MHYLESLPNPKSKHRGKRWYDFFGDPKNQGEMRIFSREMNDRKAKVIEQMLIFVLKPKFYKEDNQ